MTEVPPHSKLVQYRDLGLIPYRDAWDLQTSVNNTLKAAKREGRRGVPNQLLFCEHPPVYTIGKSGDDAHLRISEDQLTRFQIDFFRINRGGDITYHGPGQVVVYPILDLDQFFTDAHRYVRSLEEVVIRMLKEFGLIGGRIKEFTGVWLDLESEHPRKICAIGVHLSRWVTMHGFALNVNTNLSYFRHIVPCGIDTTQRPVTSMANELGSEVNTEAVKASLRKHFADVFEFQYLDTI